MKVYRISIGLLALILVLLTSGCGTLELGVESAQGKSGGSVEDVSAPLELLVARDTVLAYLRRAYADQAPGPDLDWQERETTPAEMVGSRSFEFSAAGWLMQVAFPIVAPEDTIYTISLTAPDGVLSWQGEVDAVGRITSSTADQGPLPVVAWLGHIASLPAGTAEEDVFILEPQAGEEFGIRGADSSLEAEITSLRDAEGQGEFINVWGSLDCSGEGFSGCMLTVTRLLYGASSESVDEVDGWEGVIYSGSPVPGSGGDDYFALLGPYPVQYGIWSRDEVVLAGLETQRDTGSVIRVYGQMMSGVPDWNNTQIQVDRFEAVENPSGEIPAAPTYPETIIRDGWLVYNNERYGYQIQYPPQATLEESGIQRFASDENGMPVGGLPEGVTLDTYFQYLEDTYGTNLCIQITTTLGYITISVPENEGFRYANCGRTGVGVATITDFKLDVLVDGKHYTARGMDIQSGGESLAEHNEDVVLTLDDGTRIEFGPRPVAEATFEDYLMKGRPLLLSILETYTSTR